MLKSRPLKIGTPGQRELAKRIAHRVFKPRNRPRVDRVQMISKSDLLLKEVTFQEAHSTVLSVLAEMGVSLCPVGQGNSEDVPEFFRYSIAAKINAALIDIEGEQADSIRFVSSSFHQQYGAYCAASHISEILKNSRVFFERPDARFEVTLAGTRFKSYEPSNGDCQKKCQPVEGTSERERQLVLLNSILVDLLTDEQFAKYEAVYLAEFATPEDIEWLNLEMRRPSDPDDDLEGEEWKKA